LGFFSQIDSNPNQIFIEDSTQFATTKFAEENQTKKKKKQQQQQQLRLRHCRSEPVTRGGL
jgi:hypothetical protein